MAYYPGLFPSGGFEYFEDYDPMTGLTWKGPRRKNAPQLKAAPPAPAAPEMPVVGMRPTGVSPTEKKDILADKKSIYVIDETYDWDAGVVTTSVRGKREGYENWGGKAPAPTGGTRAIPQEELNKMDNEINAERAKRLNEEKERRKNQIAANRGRSASSILTNTPSAAQVILGGY